MANSGMITLHFKDMAGNEFSLEIPKDHRTSYLIFELERKIKENDIALKFKKFNIRLFIKRNIMKNYINNTFLNPDFVDLKFENFSTVRDLLTYYDITENTTIEYLINMTNHSVAATPPPFGSIIGFDIWLNAVKKTNKSASKGNMMWRTPISSDHVIQSIDEAVGENTITQELADNVKSELVPNLQIKHTEFAGKFNKLKTDEDAKLKKIKKNQSAAERNSVRDQILAERARLQAEKNSSKGGRSYRKRNTKYHLRHSVKNSRTRRTRRTRRTH
jgi:hypothetical protein